MWCREDPPGGGPVAALAAAVPHTAADTCVVLAADLPCVGRRGRAAAALRVPADGAALLVDADGRANYLAAAWRRAALVAALAARRAGGCRARRCAHCCAACRSVPVPDAGGWGADCDTWADVEAARRSARLGR